MKSIGSKFLSIFKLFGKRGTAVVIKGNINKKNEKVYHVPEGRYYEMVKPVATFASVAEAEKAGYRRSRM